MSQPLYPQYLPLVRRFTALLALNMLFSLLPHAASAADDPPERVVDVAIHDAFTVLRNEQLRTDRARRMRELRAVVDRAFDWDAMAQSSLGPTWRELKPAQRSEFVGVFKELLAQRYMDDIDRFEGSEEMLVTGTEQQAELATVKTVLRTSSRQEIPIDYTLHKTRAGWRVEDVTIEAVSLVNHYRKTFARYLTNKSFQELMQQLKRKLGNPHDKQSE